MSKFWKALGITTVLAALVPVSIKEDKETGKKTYQSLLLSLDVKTDEAAKEKEIGLNLGDGLISSAITRAITAKQEAELFTDDPDEAVLFADDDPASAVVEAVTETAEAVAEKVEAKAEELEEKAEEFEAKAEEADVADFDPEF